ncbi:LacI family DNA-binding transcriptional regulator [Paenibacillus allorhizosphaerae]|uniref:Catabolite control protein A n=1 Tax=Paenibacillus allorhizosphaerae TaxID=2849866 RepID=A0ABN7TXU5_9BACL|nr:LacI family DNA-binding transcriptional regulator [Paenibacillus allorhizosphaerae]CAG7656359.1 Catabolite control protein A [Paenibacillus allorhizosphaerae]
MSSVKEVAKRAGVSSATVSRVLNKDPAVKPETRNKVLQIIRELNYKPNLMAKNLRKQSSKTIVMVLPTMANPFFAGIARGAQAAISQSGYNVIIGTTEFDKLQLSTYVNLLNTNLADGLILVSSNMPKEALRQLAKQHPVVLCNEYYDDLDIQSVSINNRQAGYDATCELLGRGYRSIGYITGTRESSSLLGRMSGYREALQEAGIAFNANLVAKAKSNYEQVIEVVNSIADKEKSIEGIIANSDMLASYILKGIKEGEIRLPGHVGLISFDGTFLSEVMNPALSTVAQPMYDLGFSSVGLLLQKLRNKPETADKRLFLPHRLIVRET